MTAADELAAAYVALQDIQRRQRSRAGATLHDGRRGVADELDRQTERNLAMGRLAAAEAAYRAEVGL